MTEWYAIESHFQHKEQLLNLYYMLNTVSVHVCTHICVCVRMEMEAGMREMVVRSVRNTEYA